MSNEAIRKPKAKINPNKRAVLLLLLARNYNSSLINFTYLQGYIPLMPPLTGGSNAHSIALEIILLFSLSPALTKFLFKTFCSAFENYFSCHLIPGFNPP
ncbi:hypothetical protein [Flavobacterium luteolum]|uniref:hypothetical protein n=1 Tax=Flavobacterium luteolum TaxID=3003259 RepID=UPI00248D903E|nr:hypothetical protein [Flavobacterium luteolum]